MAVATTRAERVRGVILGNTWFWPADQASMKIFGRVMSAPWMQRSILEKNFFVERIVPRGMAHRLTPAEMDHYSKVQPTPAAGKGVAEMPKQIPPRGRCWRSWPRRARHAGRQASTAGVGMKDFAFKPKALLPRMQATFPRNVTVGLPRAKHYIQEDAPGEIAQAIVKRFG
jgi:haloalkane dehalogenase